MLTHVEKSIGTARQTSPQESGVSAEGSRGERVAELLRERPLDSDSSEPDSQRFVSTCATLGN